MPSLFFEATRSVKSCPRLEERIMGPAETESNNDRGIDTLHAKRNGLQLRRLALAAPLPASPFSRSSLKSALSLDLRL
jgi:hypothetical protein